MKNYIKTFLVIFLLLIQGICSAQDNIKMLFSYNYGMGFTTGDLHNFIDKKVFDGFTIEERFFIKKNISIGISGGFNDFKKEFDRTTYPTASGNYSAIQTRYFNSVPILVNGFYYLNSISRFRPYAGLGLGVYVNHYEKFISTIPTKKTKASFGLRPEIGTLINIGNNIGLILSGRYNYATYSYGDFKNLSYFELNIGFAFLLDRKE